MNQHDLKVVASKGGGQLDGRACASSQEWLDQLVLDQRKEGDKLVVSLRREGRDSGISLGSSYAWLDIRGSVPDNLPLQLKVGSGDASVDNAQSLSVDVGSVMPSSVAPVAASTQRWARVTWTSTAAAR